MSQSEELQIHASERLYDPLVFPARLRAVRLHAVRQIRVLCIDIDLAEEICIHKVVIALIVLSRQSFILVQIHRCHFGKVQIALLIPFRQLLISADRRGTGSQSKHTVRLDDHFC